MANPATPAPTTPPLPTRRQLDELEALLQRMLELPVQQADEDEPIPNDPAEIDDAGQTPSVWGATIADHVADAPEASQTWTETLPKESLSWQNTAVPAGSPASGSTSSEKTKQRATAPLEELAPDSVRPEPGIFRILLGWSGLVCLILSLAILLLDWFGWTW